MVADQFLGSHILREQEAYFDFLLINLPRLLDKIEGDRITDLKLQQIFTTPTFHCRCSSSVEELEEQELLLLGLYGC